MRSRRAEKITGYLRADALARVSEKTPACDPIRLAPARDALDGPCENKAGKSRGKRRASQPARFRWTAGEVAPAFGISIVQVVSQMVIDFIGSLPGGQRAHPGSMHWMRRWSSSLIRMAENGIASQATPRSHSPDRSSGLAIRFSTRRRLQSVDATLKLIRSNPASPASFFSASVTAA